MCPSLKHVYLLNGDHTEKSGLSEAEIGLSGRTNAVYGYRLIFIRLNSLNTVWKSCSHAAVTDKGFYILRRKRTLVRTDVIPRNIEDQRLFKKNWILASRHVTINKEDDRETRKSPMDRGHWVTDTCYHFLELWTLLLSSRGVQLVLSFDALMVHSWSNKGLCRSKR